jgi:3-methyladenine DNA glycosylase AlkD
MNPSEPSQTLAADILARLQTQANPVNVTGMARFGIRPAHPLGISVKTLRDLAREIKRQVKDAPARHSLAGELWASAIHEARILASILDVPALVTEAQMEAWAADFDSWDIVDQCCGNLFEPTSYAIPKALEWAQREEEFVRRAGFSLMATIASHRKRLPDEAFEPFFEAILTGCTDERNFVKKAVNWALRGIGKRGSPALHRRAIEVARQMQTLDSRAARWNASDALRELEGRN